MEGNASKLSSRRIGARSGALLLALGALAVGVAACGSNSSTTATRSTAPVAKKEAGYKDVYLTVINKNPKTLFVTACEDDPDFYGHGTCRASGDLATGDSIDLTKTAVGGSIVFRGDNTVEYAAKNPDVGRPSIRLWLTGSSDTDTNQNQHDAPRFYLDEGQTVETSVGGHLFDMARSNDTDYKVMSLTVR